MSTTVLATSLQSVLQEPTAAAVAAFGLIAVLGVILWAVRGAVLTGDEPAGEPISDGGTTGFADSSTEQRAAEASAQTETDASEEELEHRLDELETEVDSLSSTVKTVRNENEQISESVKDIEENTGRLLSLYQKATRGVNPFANEAEPAETSVVQQTEQPDEESFDKEDEIEEIETDVADGSAADLFDSDGAEIREEHCVDSVEEVVDSGNEPDDAFQQTKQAERSESSDTGSESVDEVEEVTEDSFEAVFETKTVEDGTADEDDEQLFGTEEMIDAGGESTGPAASDGGQLIEPTESETEPSTESPETPTTAPTETTEQTTDPSATQTAEPSAATETDEPAETPPAVEPTTDSTASNANLSEGKPYVDSLPEGVSTEVMTVEWLEYLVDEVGIRGTIRALEYYETIGWLTEEAVAELDDYLSAFEDPTKEDLSVEHHLRSLDYVEELKHASED